MRKHAWLRSLLLACCMNSVRADEPAAIVRRLDEFGPIVKPEEAKQTYATAIEKLRQTGGVLEVPPSVWKLLKPAVLQGSTRIPEPPAETKQWRDAPGVTVISADQKQVILQVPPISGMRIERTLNLADRDSLPHWSTNPMLTLDSHLIYGSNSYLDWLQEPVEKGNDRRFYLPTVRGIRPGQFLNLHGGPGYGGGVTRGVVKDIGWDAEKQMHYFVADTSLDHKVGAILHNKNNTGLIHMLQTSNNDNQTYDVKVIRNQYAHGDTYMYYCDFNYMSNIHSAAGDENGNCFAAFTRSLDNNFRGTVGSMDWTTQRLTFASGNNVETLGDSRPLINLNPQKQTTAGKVFIVHPDEVFQGQRHPSKLIKNARHGATERYFGGIIRGDKDCPWTADVVGKFFAVSTKSEKTPKGSFRWYEIASFKANEDGTKDIEIRRYWWGAKHAGAPHLYRKENYTWDDHERPLEYIIAPGAYVNDVSRAVTGGDRGGQKQLGLAPYRDQASDLDFAKGDAIEQAIGPDPVRPQIFRAWMWDNVPGPFPSTVFDLYNQGAASRHSAMHVRSPQTTLEQVETNYEQKPSWDNIIIVDTAAGVGINFNADVSDAAILFAQPNREQPIKWNYQHVPDSDVKPKTATLTVSKETGELNFEGGGVRANGSVNAVHGISGDKTPAKNLRGKNVAVPAKSESIRITFPLPELDADYAVFIEQSWLSNRAISEKTSEGFTITFERAAPEKATLDWMLVR